MKLLFFDIDGTLVSFKTHRIPESTVAAFSAAREAGNKIIIATGRPPAIINNLSAIEHLIDGYVTMNGAYCFIGGFAPSERTVLHAATIPPTDIAAIAEACERFRKPCIFVHENEISVAGADDAVREIFCNHLNTGDLPETDYHEPCLRPVLQVTPFFTAEEQRLVEPYATHCEFGRWHPAFTDITFKGNHKAHGIDILAKHYGVDIADTVAFGDGGNDIPMLSHAGIGVAMGNAYPEVRPHADFVTASVDDDGIAKAIHELKLDKPCKNS